MAGCKCIRPSDFWPHLLEWHRVSIGQGKSRKLWNLKKESGNCQEILKMRGKVSEIRKKNDKKSVKLSLSKHPSWLIGCHLHRDAVLVASRSSSPLSNCRFPFNFFQFLFKSIIVYGSKGSWLNYTFCWYVSVLRQEEIKALSGKSQKISDSKMDTNPVTNTPPRNTPFIGLGYKLCTNL